MVAQKRAPARLRPYSGRRQITSKSAEPISSYRYFDGSSFCPGFESPARTSAAKSATEDFVQMRSINLGRAVAMSVLHAAEFRVHVRVVWLKPIAKTAAQHARRGALRAALHHEMLAVEEIGGVATIERKRLESRKRRERRRSPFPAVAEKIVNAESGLRQAGCEATGVGIPRQQNRNCRASDRANASPQGYWRSAPSACRKRRDATALPSEAFCRPSARTRTLRRGSRKPATRAAAAILRTFRGSSSRRRAESRESGCARPLRIFQFPIFVASKDCDPL